MRWGRTAIQGHGCSSGRARCTGCREQTSRNEIAKSWLACWGDRAKLRGGNPIHGDDDAFAVVGSADNCGYLIPEFSNPYGDLSHDSSVARVYT